MSEFQGMEDILQDFLLEAGELLSQADNKLVALEHRPHDAVLLNDIFRSFHTIKGGAGFLHATALVELCHLTENLFGLLRNGKLELDAPVLDTILAATAAVRAMFQALARGEQPVADQSLIERLHAAVRREIAVPSAPGEPEKTPQATAFEPDWARLYAALRGPVAPAEARRAGHGRRASDAPDAEGAPFGRRESDRLAVANDSTIRVQTHRLDDVLTLSSQIGFARNRLNSLRGEMLQGRVGTDTLRSLDAAVNQLDHLVADLQNAVMKTRMQPVGRLFLKYPRMARDLARELGKEVELELQGGDTELDRTMNDKLNDPLVHLVRNAIDHGLELPADRLALGKPATCSLRLSARQTGDHIVVEIADDGRGMRPELLRRKAVDQGLLDAETASAMGDRQSLQLIFLPGFSTKDRVSSVSGRGVGIDVVKDAVQKLNGRIEVESEPGAGTTFRIVLPLTLAILPVLIVRHGTQPFAVPLASVHEILALDPARVRLVSGRATMTIRDEVVAVRSLAALIGWPAAAPACYGVLMEGAGGRFVLAVDGYAGRENVVIKPLPDVKPKGIAGATLASDGTPVLVLDMDALLEAVHRETPQELFGKAA